MPCVSLVRITVAPGMTPPCASLTVPAMVPVVICADAIEASPSTHAAARCLASHALTAMNVASLFPHGADVTHGTNRSHTAAPYGRGPVAGHRKPLAVTEMSYQFIARRILTSDISISQGKRLLFSARRQLQRSDQYRQAERRPPPCIRLLSDPFSTRTH